MPRFLDPFSKPKGFGLKARGLQDTCHRLFIFRIYSTDKKRRFKTNLTLSLILRFNLGLGGYSIWNVIFHRTPYKRRLEAIWGMSTSYPRCNQGSSRRRPSKWSFRRSQRLLQKYSKCLQYSAMKSLGLVRDRSPGYRKEATREEKEV
jgi:hypothetical protein